MEFEHAYAVFISQEYMHRKSNFLELIWNTKFWALQEYTSVQVNTNTPQAYMAN